MGSGRRVRPQERRAEWSVSGARIRYLRCCLSRWKSHPTTLLHRFYEDYDYEDEDDRGNMIISDQAKEFFDESGLRAGDLMLTASYDSGDFRDPCELNFFMVITTPLRQPDATSSPQ